MPAWSETYRGSVKPWECDVTEHFTIAYYFDRLDEASPNLADELGIGEILRAGGFVREFNCRFAHELRAGESFQIESAPLRVDEAALLLGHRVVASDSGETLTWFQERWTIAPGRLPDAQLRAIAGRAAAWEGPAAETRPDPATTEGFLPSGAGRVKPGDLDERGGFSLAAFVHRFTDASLQGAAAIGMDAEYMQTQRRAFSTFELILRVEDAPRLSDAYRVDTGIVHLGSSSLRYLHRLFDPKSGREYARLSQFGVQLDLDARRPTAFPEDLRARAAQMLVATRPTS